jgi:hypothetical protein
LYKSGAAKLFVCFSEPDKDDPVERVGIFVAELPKDGAARKKVIGTHNKFWEKYLEDLEDEEELKDRLTEDSGQQYIVIQID